MGRVRGGRPTRAHRWRGGWPKDLSSVSPARVTRLSGRQSTSPRLTSRHQVGVLVENVHMILDAKTDQASSDWGRLVAFAVAEGSAWVRQTTSSWSETGTGLANMSSTGQCSSTARWSSSYRSGVSGPLTRAVTRISW